MATTLYLRNTTSTYAPTAGTKSAVLPNGTDRSLTANDSLSLLSTAGESDTTVSITTAAQTAQQSGRFARFASERLSAQSISANTWTVYLRDIESNAFAYAYLAISAYVWRPSTSAVVGYIRDSTTVIGSEWTTNNKAVTYTFSGSAVTAQLGDVVVFEIWYSSTQGKSNAYTVSILFDLTSYVSTPQDLSFYVEEPDRVFCWILD